MANAGTPSLAKPSTIEAVINAVADNTLLHSDAEINLEANPTSTELEKLRYNNLMMGLVYDEVFVVFMYTLCIMMGVVYDAFMYTLGTHDGCGM